MRCYFLLSLLLITAAYRSFKYRHSNAFQPFLTADFQMPSFATIEIIGMFHIATIANTPPTIADRSKIRTGECHPHLINQFASEPNHCIQRFSRINSLSVTFFNKFSFYSYFQHLQLFSNLFLHGRLNRSGRAPQVCIQRCKESSRLGKYRDLSEPASGGSPSIRYFGDLLTYPA